MPPCSTGLGNHISRYTIPNFATLPKVDMDNPTERDTL